MKSLQALLLLLAASAPAAAQSGERYERKVIYHSPQTPGYTSWVGAVRLADGSFVAGFTQATGPLDPAARERAPRDLTDRMGVTALIQREPNYDFWGLSLSAIYRRSTDGGATWQAIRSDPYHAVYPHGYAAQGLFALPDGTLVRRINGWDLLHDPNVPHTAYLQRLAPGAAAWTAPQVLLDPATHTYQLSRMRRLKDGRLLATGQMWTCPAGTANAQMQKAPASNLIVVSEDLGKTWTTIPVAVPSGSYLSVNEWDCAELANGDLLAVFRTWKSSTDHTQVRRQGLFKKQGASWTLTGVKDAPFPHSGHPELLVTREGPVLHIATNGIHWTSDGGQTWTALPFPKLTAGYKSPYYPVSFQAPDGAVHVFGHVGSDDWYGRHDQSVIMQKFHLAGFSAPPPPPPPPGDGAPKGHWKLDDAAGSTAADSSGGGHPGTLTNGPAWWDAGRLGGAVTFDGIDDHVEIGTSGDLAPTAAVTVAAWLSIASKTAEKKAVARWADAPSSAYSYLLTIKGATHDKPAFAVQTGAIALVEAMTAMETGRWYHVAGTYDGAHLKVYVDGMLEASRALTGAIRSTVASFRIGSGSGSDAESPYDGEIDDVRLYDRALSESEIQALAAAAPPVPPAVSLRDGSNGDFGLNDKACGALGAEVLLVLAALRGCRR